MSSTVKSVLLLSLLTGLLLVCGHLIGGPRGMTVAFFVSCFMNFGAYWFSDRIVLSLYRAQPLEETEAPDVYEIVRGLSKKGGLPMPRIFLIPSASSNAFATGRNPQNAVVAVTQGILETLNFEELKGVLAHELAHVEHRDILTSSIVATLAGAIGFLASMARWSVYFGGGSGSRRRRGSDNPIGLLLVAFFMPLAAALVQTAVSRTREFHADEWSGKVCGNPLYLASALRKIEAASKKIPMVDARPESAHLFILSPLSGGGWANLFSTHPPIEERIARLEEMARQQGL